VVVSVLSGLAVLVLLVSGRTRLVRPVAVLAVAAVVWGWAVAQYPYLLPPRLTIAAAAAPAPTEVALLVVVGIIAVLVVPSFAILYRLTLGGRLGGTGMAVAASGSSRSSGAGSEAAAYGDGTATGRLAAAAVLVLVAAEGVRRWRGDHGAR